RGHEHASAEGQIERREQIVGNAMGRFGEKTGRGRRNHEQFAALSESNVRSQRKLGLVKDLAGNRPAGKGGKSGGSDELLAGRGQYHRHARAILDELADESRRFERGYATGHADDDFSHERTKAPKNQRTKGMCSAWFCGSFVL